MYLFGKVVPAFSLLLSMAMRFLPLFLHQAKEISRAQRCMGRDGSMGSLWHRAKCSVRMCSILILWALENAIETADSMKSRGYGLPGRTAYSRYEWEERDKMALWYMAFAAALLFVFGHGGSFVFRYYPSIVLAGPSIWNGSGWVCFGALLFLPHGLEWRENRLWQRRKVEVGE